MFKLLENVVVYRFSVHSELWFCFRPAQVKWPLMVASCHRRSGNYQQALDTYKHIHKRFPDNVDCESIKSVELVGTKWKQSLEFCFFLHCGLA